MTDGAIWQAILLKMERLSASIEDASLMALKAVAEEQGLDLDRVKQVYRERMMNGGAG